MTDRMNSRKSSNFILSIVIFATMIRCGTEVVIVKKPYHPYYANQLCPIEIIGDLKSVISISILLDSSNVSDLENDSELKPFVLVKPGAEHYLPFHANNEKFQDKIPCRNQTIRIRYLIEEESKYLDIEFHPKKLRSIRIAKKTHSNELYEKK